MFTKICASFLVIVLINLSLAQIAVAQDKDEAKRAKQEEKAQEHIEKVKDGVRKIGRGDDAKVNVTLLNKTKIKGYITDIEDETFTVREKNGDSTVIRYEEVQKIKGNNVPAGVWIAVGAAAGLGVFLLAILYAISKN